VADVEDAVEHRIAEVDVAAAMSILARSTRAPFWNSPAHPQKGGSPQLARGTGCSARLGERARVFFRISSWLWSST
jgi:hypothetical protein